MATIDSLVTDITNYVADNLGVIAASVAVEAVNQAIRRMVREHDWRALQKSVDLTIPGGNQNFVRLPPDFLHEAAVWNKNPNQSDPSLRLTPVDPVLLIQWANAIDPSVQSDPIFPSVAAPSTSTVTTDRFRYYTWAENLYILKVQSAAITVQLDYASLPIDLEAGQSPADHNPLTDRWPDVVRWGALAETYLFLHELDLATGAEVLFQQRLASAIKADNSRAFAGASRARGG